MAKQVEQLKLDDEHATAIVELGIEYEAYESDLPKTKKDRLAAAQEVITFCEQAKRGVARFIPWSRKKNILHEQVPVDE